MRVLFLVTLIAFVSAPLVAANAGRTGIADVDSKTNILPRVLAAENNQVKLSLRHYYSDELNELDPDKEVDSGKEERQIIRVENIDDVVSKVTKTDEAVSKAAKTDDMVEKAVKADDMVEKAAKVSKWKILQKKTKEFAETGKLVKRLKANVLYNDIEVEKLSLSALRQLDDIEDLRKLDILNKVKGTKETPDGMRRKMVHTENTKLPPAKFLVSHVGRDAQLLDANKQRLLSAAVVSTGDDINEKVLLISSSNPKKGDFLLPKGGWDEGETVEKAALREVIEEGGVKGQLLHKLGDFEFTEGSTATAYMMKTTEKYDDWAESIRYRISVSYDDAIVLLGIKRPHMADVVRKAKETDELIALGKLPAADENLEKIKLF